jgi:hypothetical protein
MLCSTTPGVYKVRSERLGKETSQAIYSLHGLNGFSVLEVTI